MTHQLNDIARTGAKVHTILRDVTAAVPGATVRDARLAWAVLSVSPAGAGPG